MDVIQAIGRAMRLADGKKARLCCYPNPNRTRPDARGVPKGMRVRISHIIGQVLRALQAHDQRLIEEPFRFIPIKEVGSNIPELAPTA